MWLRRQGAGQFGAILKDDRGSVAVEFALIVTPFVALIFAILQTGLVLYLDQSLQTATNRAGRMVMTGEAGSMNQAAFQAAVCGNLPSYFRCANVWVDLKSAGTFSSLNTTAPTPTYNSQGQITNSWSFSQGARGDVAILRVMYRWPILSSLGAGSQPNGDVLMVGTTVFQNEP